MRIGMSKENGAMRPIVVPTGKEYAIDVASAWEKAGGTAESRPQSVVELLEMGDEGFAMLERVVAAAGDDEAAKRRLEELRLGAPIPRPGKILCVGRNYWDHAKENMAGWEERGVEYKMPSWPKAFVKVPSSVIGPDDELPYPRFSQALDYEIEFSIVIGKEAHYVSEEDAMDYVAGYTIVNDITARDIQHKEQEFGQHCLGKNFVGSAPLGPLVTLQDEIPDPHNLNLELRVNGETRQSANTQDLIFKVPRIVSHWSQAKLEVGDVLTTGTPAGVAAWRDDWWLEPGDVVEAEVERVGVLRNHIV